MYIYQHISKVEYKILNCRTRKNIGNNHVGLNIMWLRRSKWSRTDIVDKVFLGYLSHTVILTIKFITSTTPPIAITITTN